MTQVEHRRTRSAIIREELGHPVVDGDGHIVELLPVFIDFAHDHGHGELIDAAKPRLVRGPAQQEARLQLSTDELRRAGSLPDSWHVSANPDYYATCALPALYYERLDETGIDFAVLYPDVGHQHAPAARRRAARDRVPAVQRVHGRAVPAVPRPLHRGGPDPDDHSGRSRRRARAREGPRRQGRADTQPRPATVPRRRMAAHRPGSRAAHPAVGGERLGRHLRSRQRVRLRLGVGEGHRAADAARRAHRGHRLQRSFVGHQLRVQPDRPLRRVGRGAGEVARPRRRDPSIPGPAPRAARGRRRLRCEPAQRPGAHVEEAQRPGDRAPRPRNRRPGAARPDLLDRSPPRALHARAAAVARRSQARARRLRRGARLLGRRTSSTSSASASSGGARATTHSWAWRSIPGSCRPARR